MRHALRNAWRAFTRALHAKRVQRSAKRLATLVNANRYQPHAACFPENCAPPSNTWLDTDFSRVRLS